MNKQTINHSMIRSNRKISFHWVIILYTFQSFVQSMDPNSISKTITPTSTSLSTNSDFIVEQEPISKQTFSKIPVLILDVDNTFYNERKLKQLSPSFKKGIEEQIIKNTHAFCESYLNMTANECDDLYHLYGSTPEGLRAIYSDSTQLLNQFYNQVYDKIDMSCLLRYSHHPLQRYMDNSNTGYTHESSTSSFISYSQRLYDLFQQIKNIRYNYEQHEHPIRIYLASNSPYKHIYRILQAMGLSSLDLDGIITPDAPSLNRHLWHPSILTDQQNTNEFIPYPTKATPRSFFQPILDKHSPTNHTFIFMDDSLYNLEKANKADIGFDHMVPIHDTNDLCKALESFLQDLEKNKEKYQFSEESYLLSKNIVDAQSIHRNVWKQVQQELVQKSIIKEEPMIIVDLGAGLLSILDLFMNGFPIQQTINEKEDGILDLLHPSNQESSKLIYYAYEPNHNLLSGCQQKLMTLGFQEISQEDHIYIYHHKDKQMTVHLIMQDFRYGKNIPKSPDLIVGCCFADLFANPRELISSIIQLTNIGLSIDSSTLLYFPITFAGTTLLDPPQPFGISKTKMIPSDTLALRFYSNTLQNVHEHNLNPNSIIQAVQDFGGTFLSSSPSDWIIDPNKDSYLWDTMRYFFHSVIKNIPEKKKWNIHEWLHRIQKNRPTIIAKNVDLLFRFDSNNTKINENDLNKNESKTNIVEEIEFVAPNHVHSKKMDWGELKKLDPNEVEVESICSLISSGTELKIFRGTFDNSEPLDVNIKGMSDTAMSYPLSYGYSLVGKIIRCGSSKNHHFIGKYIFTFSPHSSHVICDLNDIHIIPDGISPEDAIFLPSVETALSIIHDAHIQLGERVAVFGQGLIGLLVTSILALNKYEMKTQKSLFGTVTAFDTLSYRLAAASSVGASEALLPSSAMEAGPFDVTIEVSGNGRALQSAIDCTSDHGRIIIGSWYGNSNVPLKLGMDFHRSHKTLLATQVSEIPPKLTGLWNKQRRFDLTWELIKRLKPSQTLITKWEPLENAQKAYEALESGNELAVAFFYNSNK